MRGLGELAGGEVGVADAAELLDVSPETVRNYVRSGVLTELRRQGSGQRAAQVLDLREVRRLAALPRRDRRPGAAAPWGARRRRRTGEAREAAAARELAWLRTRARELELERRRLEGQVRRLDAQRRDDAARADAALAAVAASVAAERRSLAGSG